MFALVALLGAVPLIILYLLRPEPVRRTLPTFRFALSGRAALAEFQELRHCIFDQGCFIVHYNSTDTGEILRELKLL
ncbi:hypothetical protein C9J85_11570 [Haloferax sp. wsp5]|nr:hypothetical protein C9J85_11570 [Haloferax sp. wsp5]